MGNKEEQEMLRKAGFTKAEINRLSTLRRNPAEECKYYEVPHAQDGSERDCPLRS
jgi:hypothetical protein